MPETSEVNVLFNKHLCLLESPSNLSSHDVIVGSISFPLEVLENISKKHTDSYTKFIVKKPIWNSDGLTEYQNDTHTKLKYLLDEFSNPEHLPVLTELCSKMLLTLPKQQS